jgi:DNA polymerase III alpha subunit (gram-positive type)
VVHVVSLDIPPFITDLTSIMNDNAANAEQLPEAADAFIRFMQQNADEFEGSIDHVILVGHYGKVFDIPFFIQQLSRNQMVERFVEDDRFGFGLDTSRLARKAIKKIPRRECQRSRRS